MEPLLCWPGMMNWMAGVKEWKLAHQKNTRESSSWLKNLTWKKELSKPSILNLKLQIIKQVQWTGKCWNSKIRATPNIPDASKPTDIRQVTELAVAGRWKSLVLPKLQVKSAWLVATNRVVDLNNKIYKPLTDQTVKGHGPTSQGYSTFHKRI